MKQQITHMKPSFTLLTALLSFSGVFPAPADRPGSAELLSRTWGNLKFAFEVK